MTGKLSSIKGFSLLIAVVVLILNFGLSFFNPVRGWSVTISSIILIAGLCLSGYLYKKWSKNN